MDTLTKNFLKFIANNKGLLDKETLDIIVTYSNSRKPCSLDPLGQGWIEKK